MGVGFRQGAGRGRAGIEAGEGGNGGSGVRGSTSLRVPFGAAPRPQGRAAGGEGCPGLSESDGARPRKQGGAAARPGLRRRLPRGAGEAARQHLPGSTRGFARVATAAGPWEKLRAWAPRGPGRTPHRTHRGRTTGSKGDCGRSSERGSPLPSQAHSSGSSGGGCKGGGGGGGGGSSYPGSGIGGGGGGSSTSAPVTTSAPARAPPRPCAGFSLGERATGLPRPPERGADGGRRRGEETRTPRTRSEEEAGGGGRKWGRKEAVGEEGVEPGEEGTCGNLGTGRGEGLGGREPQVLRSLLGLGTRQDQDHSLRGHPFPPHPKRNRHRVGG
uniref:uncharacterized protein LOC132672337 n=1 Tax=Panthera onca TaxID=9690 RepID=UPI0029536F5B|nr:uncharacterized protein LOC132672337 [Panthera onca]